MRKTALLALLFAAPLFAGEGSEKKTQDKAKSGCEKGSGVPVFDVLDVTGPNASKELCYV